MSIPQATVNSDLPPGTRLVLEVPDPQSPSGYRVETPLIGSFVEALAPAILELAALAETRTRRTGPDVLTPAPAQAAIMQAPPAPACPRCNKPKTIKPGGKNYTCTPCHAQAVSAGRAGRRKAA